MTRKIETIFAIAGLDLNLKDRDGRKIELGDVIELYDWGNENAFLGQVTLRWDSTTCSINSDPGLVEDQYDFIQKAIPNSRLIRKAE